MVRALLQVTILSTLLASSALATLDRGQLDEIERLQRSDFYANTADIIEYKETEVDGSVAFTATLSVVARNTETKRIIFPKISVRHTAQNISKLICDAYKRKTGDQKSKITDMEEGFYFGIGGSIYTIWYADVELNGRCKTEN